LQDDPADQPEDGAVSGVAEMTGAAGEGVVVVSDEERRGFLSYAGSGHIPAGRGSACPVVDTRKNMKKRLFHIFPEPLNSKP
jgi:hypothetical protein